MIWRSKKKVVQVVGWCSETEAIIGMYLVAYVGSSKVRERPVQRVILEMRRERERDVPKDLDQNQENHNSNDEGKDEEEEFLIVLGW